MIDQNSHTFTKPDPSQEVAAVRKLIDQLIAHLGLEVGDYGRLRVKPEPKPVIKGGWVNVYRDNFGRAAISALHSCREDADAWNRDDNRIRRACIQIPDFTEGEGLNPHER